MSVLNPNIPDSDLSKLLTSAAEKMKDFDVKYLTPQILLHEILETKETAAFQILQQLQKNRGFNWDDLVRRVEMMAQYSKGRNAKFDFTDDFGRNIPLAEEMLFVLDEGLTIAQARDELKVSSGHALAAMAMPKVTTFAVLQRIGVTTAAVTALLNEVAVDGTPVLHDYVHDARQGEAQAVFQRESLLRDLMSLLSLAANRHVILVGAEGSGRRTLVYSLALLIAEEKGPDNIRSVVQINETALLENPMAAMRSGLRRASGGILLVPGIERFFTDRLRAQFPEKVSRELHKAILNNDQVIVGTTTPALFDKLEKDPIIRQNAHRLDVPPATKEEAVSMLNFHKQRLEQEYEIDVTRDGLETAVTLAAQYIKTTAMPAAAVQLANRACALVRMITQESSANGTAVKPDGRLDPDDVMAAASMVTKIPISKLSEDEQGRYANMVQHIHQRLIGQEEAVLAVSRAVKTARVGLRNPKRPIGSFLFLGPSGVGKTELAKVLAEFMFGTEKAMLVLDMSEYQEEASVNKLIGAPPGYIGFEGGGQLTNFVRQRPYTVVLFDEIEKAHPRVFDVLLQVMEEGRLTDSQGRLATFAETVIIMTSNLGSNHMLVPIIGERERTLVMAEVHQFLRPEFLNRLDDIIFFHQLTGDQLAKILDLMLKKEFKLAAGQGINLTVTPGAKQWLLAQNDQPEYGARPLRRIIARHLREPLADFLLSQKSSKNRKVSVQAGPDILEFKIS